MYRDLIRARAADDRARFLERAGLHTEIRGYLLRYFRSAGTAPAGVRRFARGKCGGVTRAARKTAAAAVGAGQERLDILRLFIDGDGEDLCRDRKKDARRETYACNKYDR